MNFANKKAELSSAFLIVFQKFKLLKGFCFCPRGGIGLPDVSGHQAFLSSCSHAPEKMSFQDVAVWLCFHAK